MTCVWRCGDETPDHQHYAVLARDEGGKVLGRLAPDGTAVRRNIFAMVLSKARAAEIAAEITADESHGITAKAIHF